MADGSIVLTTEIDDSGIKKGLTGLKSGMATFGKVVGGVTAGVIALGAASATAFVNGVKSTAEYGDRVDKLSQKIGMSKKSFQEWDYIMQINGGSVEQLQMGLKTLSQQAQKGSEAFGKLGISQEFVKSASPEALFEQTIKSLQGMPESTERTAIATQLLGRSATELAPLLNSDAQSIEELKKQAEDYGMIMSDEAVAASAAFNDSLTTLSGAVTGLKNKFMAEFLPAITQVTDGMSKVFAGDMSGAEGMANGIDSFISQINAKIPQLLNGLITIFSEMGPVITNGIIELGVTIISQLPTLITQIADAVQNNLPLLIQGIVNAVNGVAAALPGILNALIPAVIGIISMIAAQLPTAIPQLLAGVMQMIVAIAQALPELITAIIEALPEIIVNVATALIECIPILIDAGIQIFNALAAALPEIALALLEAVGTLALEIGQKLFNILPEPLQNAFRTAFEKVKQVWDAVQPYFAAVGEKVKSVWETVSTWVSDKLSRAWEIIKGVWDAVQPYFQIVGDTVKGIWDAVAPAISEGFTTAWEIIKGVWDTVTGYFSAVWETIKGIFSVVSSVLSGDFSAAGEAINGIVSAWSGFFSNTWNTIKSVFSSVTSFFSTTFTAAWNAIKVAWNGVSAFFSGIISKIKSIFNGLVSSMRSIGSNIIHGLINGITRAAGALYDKARSIASNVVSTLKSALKMHSPSKVMRDEVGKYISMGIAVGIEDGAIYVINALESLVTDTRSYTQKLIDESNEELLDGEKWYNAEYERITKEREQKALDEKLAAAKTQEERDKILNEERLAQEKKAEDEYLKTLKDAADRERKLYEAQQKDREAALKETVDGLKSTVEEYKKAAQEVERQIEQIEKDQERYAKKLIDSMDLMDDAPSARDNQFSDFADLLKTTTRQGTTRKRLNDLTEETNKLRQYADMLLKIKERENVPIEFFQELRDMGYEESYVVIDRLMELSADKFDEYIETWKTFRAEQISATNALYSDDIKLEQESKKVLANLDEQTSAYEEYFAMLDELKNRKNVPKEFFQMLRDMNYDEGRQYAGLLLELSDSDFKHYIETWQRQQNTAKEISKQLYKDEADELIYQTHEKFKGVEQEFLKIGHTASEEFQNGFVNNLKIVAKNIKEAIADAFDGVFPQMQFAGAASIPVPAMATGGIVPRATLAMVGERGREAVLPLENNTGWMDTLAAKIRSSKATTVILQVGEREFGRAVVDLGGAESRVQGVSLIK